LIGVHPTEHTTVLADRRAIMGWVSDDSGENDGLTAALRWLTEQVGRSVERLGELDVDELARAIGVDVDRAREFVDGAGQWLNDQAASFASEAAAWAGTEGAATSGRDALRGAGPHPLDVPTAAQGLALSALDSGRWTVEPGSHLLVAHGEGPVPADAVGLVGELRARDWINAAGEVTLVGRSALKRWMAQAEAD
jgi:hypothetical protein